MKHLLIAAASALMLATHASADVIYESPSFPFNAGGLNGTLTVTGPDNSKEGFRQVATRFSFLGGDVFLDAVSIRAEHFNNSNSFDFGIYADNSGVPGASLETIAGITLPASVDVNTTAFAGTTVLQAGVDYWVVLTGNGDANGEWYDTEGSPVTPIATRTSPTGSWSVSNSPGRAISLRVEGTPVPEPTSLALLGLGGLAVLTRRTH